MNFVSLMENVGQEPRKGEERKEALPASASWPNLCGAV
jgi:hypothetical protein